MEKYKIGKIVNAVGLKGEVRVYNYSDYKERFAELDEVYTDNGTLKITGVRYMKDLAILKIEGVNDRNEAEALKGIDLYITEEMLRILPEDTYYIKDLMGLKVINEKGDIIGFISDIIQNSAHDLYEIQTEDKGKILLPAVEEFVLDINMQEKIMTVKLIEGLVDL